MPPRGVRAEDIIYKELVGKPGSVFYQNELCKKLGLNSKTVSKVLKKFEEKGIVKREKAYRSGKITYRITLLKRREDIELESQVTTTIAKPTLDAFIEIPCFSCIYMDSCYEGGYHEPKSCPWIRKWLEDSVKQ